MQISRRTQQPSESLKRFTGFRAALAIAAFIALLGSLPLTTQSNPFVLPVLAKASPQAPPYPHPHPNEHSAPEDHGSASLEALPDKLQDYLGLSKEQQTKISRLSEDGRKKSLPHSQKLTVERQALWTYLKSPGATEAGAKKRINELRVIRHQLGELRLHTWFAIRKVLTPQQLEKLKNSPL